MASAMIFNHTCSKAKCQQFVLLLRKLRHGLNNSPSILLCDIKDVTEFFDVAVGLKARGSVRIYVPEKLALNWIDEAYEHDFLLQDSVRSDLIPDSNNFFSFKK